MTHSHDVANRPDAQISPQSEPRAPTATAETPSATPSMPRRAQPQHKRWWAAMAALLAAGFVSSVILSAHNAAVPVGGTSPSVMSMTAGAVTSIAITTRDVDGRPISLPGGRAGIIVFIKADGSCQSCIAASRLAADAIERTGGRAALTIVSVDSATSREQIQAFARSAGQPPARYVVDNRSGSLSPMLGASMLAGLVVYDARGRIVGRPDATDAQVQHALHRADPSS